MIYGYLSTDNPACLIKNVSRTTYFFERLVGLLASPPLEADKGLLIDPCSSIHTLGMRYKIDIVFIDKDWKIVKTIKALKPWRMASASKACMVLELAENRLEKLELTHGQKLEWHENDS